MMFEINMTNIEAIYNWKKSLSLWLYKYDLVKNTQQMLTCVVVG